MEEEERFHSAEAHCKLCKPAAPLEPLTMFVSVTEEGGDCSTSGESPSKYMDWTIQATRKDRAEVLFTWLLCPTAGRLGQRQRKTFVFPTNMQMCISISISILLLLSFHT